MTTQTKLMFDRNIWSGEVLKTYYEQCLSREKDCFHSTKDIIDNNFITISTQTLVKNEQD